MNLALRITKWSHLPRFAHTLNLIVQGAIAADDQLSSLETKCKHIVSYFHRSVTLNLPTHKLIQEVETRWNSTFYMFQQYLEQHNAITTTLCLLDKKYLCLDNIEHMKDAVGLLGLFKSVTTEVSSEAYVFLSKVIPLVFENNHLLAASTFLDPRFIKIAFTQTSAANECQKHLLNMR
uniref:hAT-like transposase RNase-H fold domain-containing protein n=1 Tax=Amphimedon queenslandica TaxID=400682 RepID=A0A1X7U6N5_AMPQE